MQLQWSSQFKRRFKQLTRKDPQLRSSIKQTLELLLSTPFHPTLKTHKLKGDLNGIWACSIDYSKRILFTFVLNENTGEEEILLLVLGSHDDVY